MTQPGLLITHTQAPMRHKVLQKERGGFKVYCQPLLKIIHLPVAPLEINPQAIVLTSANGSASLENSDWDRDIPVFGVGDATVSAAKAAGFHDCSSPNAKPYPSAVRLVDWLVENLKPDDGPIVHGGGEVLRYDVADMLTKRGFDALRVMLYKTKGITELEPEIIQALRDGSMHEVLIASEQALIIFANLCRKYGVDIKKFKIQVPSRYLKNAAYHLGFTAYVLEHRR